MMKFFPSFISGHFQTLRASLLSKKLKTVYRRERWETTPKNIPDGDFIDVDFVDSDDLTKPLIVLFHGLEGSSHSHYALGVMSEVQKRGWAGAVPHFRGCSGVSNLLPRCYHSGDVEEIDWIIERLAKQNPTRAIYVCGFSLGGNVLLLWLGRRSLATLLVKSAVAISTPMDLAASVKALSKGFSRLYTLNFLRTLKKKALLKTSDFHCTKAIQKAKNLKEFDDAFTAPIHGFLNAEEYWFKSSSKSSLQQINVPTLILNALNDPFIPKESLPKQKDVSRFVFLEQPLNGGHVGFTKGCFSDKNQKLAERLMQFFLAS